MARKKKPAPDLGQVETLAGTASGPVKKQLYRCPKCGNQELLSEHVETPRCGANGCNYHQIMNREDENHV